MNHYMSCIEQGWTVVWTWFETLSVAAKVATTIGNIAINFAIGFSSSKPAYSATETHRTHYFAHFNQGLHYYKHCQTTRYMHDYFT